MHTFPLVVVTYQEWLKHRNDKNLIFINSFHIFAHPESVVSCLKQCYFYILFSHEFEWSFDGERLHTSDTWRLRWANRQSDKREFLSRNVNKNTNGFFSSSPHSSPPLHDTRQFSIFCCCQRYSDSTVAFITSNFHRMMLPNQNMCVEDFYCCNVKWQQHRTRYSNVMLLHQRISVYFWGFACHFVNLTWRLKALGWASSLNTKITTGAQVRTQHPTLLRY